MESHAPRSGLSGGGAARVATAAISEKRTRLENVSQQESRRGALGEHAYKGNPTVRLSGKKRGDNNSQSSGSRPVIIGERWVS